MIEHEDQYFTFIKANGVGAKDKVKDASPESYLKYLRAVSRILAIKISPSTVKSYNDVTNIICKLKGKRADSTIAKYATALRRYAEMVQKYNL